MGPGTGTVNIFDVNGLILQRLTTDIHLNAPWGVAFAPGQCGSFSYALMVGNFADGQINAYDPFTGDWLGTMMDGKGNPISIPACGRYSSEAAARTAATPLRCI